MGRNIDISGDPITVQFDPEELLALYSFLALGGHFAAIISGENSPFSPDELRNHIATVGDTASNTHTDKLAGAAHCLA